MPYVRVSEKRRGKVCYEIVKISVDEKTLPMGMVSLGMKSPIDARGCEGMPLYLLAKILPVDEDVFVAKHGKGCPVGITDGDDAFDASVGKNRGNLLLNAFPDAQKSTVRVPPSRFFGSVGNCGKIQIVFPIHRTFGGLQIDVKCSLTPFGGIVPSVTDVYVGFFKTS